MTKQASIKQEDPTVRRSFLSKELVEGPAKFPKIQTVADGASHAPTSGNPRPRSLARCCRADGRAPGRRVSV